MNDRDQEAQVGRDDVGGGDPEVPRDLQEPMILTPHPAAIVFTEHHAWL